MMGSDLNENDKSKSSPQKLPWKVHLDPYTNSYKERYSFLTLEVNPIKPLVMPLFEMVLDPSQSKIEVSPIVSPTDHLSQKTQTIFKNLCSLIVDQKERKINYEKLKEKTRYLLNSFLQSFHTKEKIKLVKEVQKNPLNGEYLLKRQKVLEFVAKHPLLFALETEILEQPKYYSSYWIKRAKELATDLSEMSKLYALMWRETKESMRLFKNGPLKWLGVWELSFLRMTSELFEEFQSLQISVDKLKEFFSREFEEEMQEQNLQKKKYIEQIEHKVSAIEKQLAEFKVRSDRCAFTYWEKCIAFLLQEMQRMQLSEDSTALRKLRKWLEKAQDELKHPRGLSLELQLSIQEIAEQLLLDPLLADLLFVKFLRHFITF